MSTGSITPRFGELAGDLAAGTGDGRAALVFLPGLTFDRTMWGAALSSLQTIDPGRTTLGSARYAPRLLWNATSDASTMAPPVIERIADHAVRGRPHLLQPARLWEDIPSGHMA